MILDFRNQQLADRIAKETNPLIYITYGSGHLPGLLKDLQAIDPKWEVRSVKWQRVIEAPDDVTGQLSSWLRQLTCNFLRAWALRHDGSRPSSGDTADGARCATQP